MSSLVLVAQSSQGGGMSMIIMMVAIFAIMWFFMIKPQQKKQKEIQKFQNELTEGTQVVTGGGIYGTVKSIDLAKNTVDVKIAKDVVVTVDKSYVFKDRSNHRTSRTIKDYQGNSYSVTVSLKRYYVKNLGINKRILF